MAAAGQSRSSNRKQPDLRNSAAATVTHNTAPSNTKRNSRDYSPGMQPDAKRSGANLDSEIASMSREDAGFFGIGGWMQDTSNSRAAKPEEFDRYVDSITKSSNAADPNSETSRLPSHMCWKPYIPNTRN